MHFVRYTFLLALLISARLPAQAVPGYYQDVRGEIQRGYVTVAAGDAASRAFGFSPTADAPPRQLGPEAAQAYGTDAGLRYVSITPTDQTPGGGEPPAGPRFMRPLVEGPVQLYRLDRTPRLYYLGLPDGQRLPLRPDTVWTSITGRRHARHYQSTLRQHLGSWGPLEARLLDLPYTDEALAALLTDYNRRDKNREASPESWRAGEPDVRIHALAYLPIGFYGDSTTSPAFGIGTGLNVQVPIGVERFGLSIGPEYQRLGYSVEDIRVRLQQVRLTSLLRVRLGSVRAAGRLGVLAGPVGLFRKLTTRFGQGSETTVTDFNFAVLAGLSYDRGRFGGFVTAERRFGGEISQFLDRALAVRPWQLRLGLTYRLK